MPLEVLCTFPDSAEKEMLFSSNGYKEEDNIFTAYGPFTAKLKY